MTTLKNWHETNLWIQLESLDKSVAALPAVRGLLDDAQVVLQQGNTSAQDFTLHDAQHGFRVAQRMWELVPPGLRPNLSAQELALALLAAYLHDIGMTPEAVQINAHRTYLLTGEKTDLTPAAQETFDVWLGSQEPVPDIPMSKRPLSATDLSRAELLVAHYARARHNDWSETWIRARVDATGSTLYNGWVEDLVRLCKSHHWGYRELSTADFDPRHVRDNSLVHLRFLACVLRLADILENDPERTPSVIYSHRAISPGSRVYWWKDHDLATTTFHHQETNGERRSLQVRLTARPTSAVVHHALLETARAIEQELRLCHELSLSRPFSSIRTGEALPHRWDIEPSLTTDIQERPGTYVYIEGSFRPRTERLLELLGGHALYDSELSAVRELLQNAFDAVRIQIAHERLARPDGQNERCGKLLANTHSVRLTLEERPGGETWLVCSDDGVGMSREVIQDRLLVSGPTRKPEVVALKSECEKRGIPLALTGKFGVGALSYFMLCDRVEITTAPSLESAAVGGIEKWKFVTDGLGTFGELREYREHSRGTKVALRLSPHVLREGVQEWCKRLLDYLNKCLCSVPCTTTIELLSNPALHLAPGGIRNEDWIRSYLFKSPEDPGWRTRLGLWTLKQEHKELIPRRLAERLDPLPMLAVSRDLIGRAQAALRLAHQDGPLPNGLGHFRITMPFFETENGRCLGFVDEVSRTQDSLELRPMHTGLGWKPSCAGAISWHGMRLGQLHDGSIAQLIEGRLPDHTKHYPAEPLAAFVWVDLNSVKAGTLKANREDVDFTTEALEAFQHVGRTIDALRLRILSEQPDPMLLFLFLDDTRNPDADLINGKAFYWPTSETRISVPTGRLHDSYEVKTWGTRYETAVLCVSNSLPTAIVNQGATRGRRPPPMIPDELGYIIRTDSGRKKFKLVAVWTQTTVRAFVDSPQLSAPYPFPDAWRAIAGIHVGGGRYLWNSHHLIQTRFQSGMHRPRADTPTDLRQVDPHLLDDPQFSLHYLREKLATLMGTSSRLDSAIWTGICEKMPELVQRIWRSALGTDGPQSVIFGSFNEFDGTLTLIEIDLNGCRWLSDDECESILTAGDCDSVYRVDAG